MEVTAGERLDGSLIVDGFPLLFRRAGIGRYTYEIVRHLAADARGTRVHLANVGWRTSRKQVPANDTESWLDRLANGNRYFGLSFSALPRLIREKIVAHQSARLRAPVYFAPNFLGVFGRAFRTVITVHDMAYHVYPECALPAMRRALSRYLPEHVERAHTVLADSEATKRDIIRILGTPAEKIAVVPLAVGPSFRPILDVTKREAVRHKYGLPESYILYVGTVEPRKNLPVLLNAFSRLARTPGFRHRLVVVGAAGWHANSVLKEIEHLQSQGLLTYLGYVHDEDLPTVYSLADLFVFPSLYEGFGIPPLEAMACGVPVICSDSSSLPEVVGDAAILVAPRKGDDLFDAIGRVLDDRDVSEDLRIRGLSRVKQFSWSATAHTVARHLRNAADHAD
jgi:glycosyltransferase involved in cell wall biosynthesis